MFAKRGILGLVAVLALAGWMTSASAGTFSTYTCSTSWVCTTGTVPIVGGNFDLISDNDTNPLASGLQFQPTGTLTPSELTTLSAAYSMTSGAFFGGSPRFTLFDGSGGAAYVYWGIPQSDGSFVNANPNDTFGTTGNYADLSLSDARVQVNGFGGQPYSYPYETWSAFVASLGNTAISYITLDLDGGWGVDQEMLVQAFTVNGATFTAPEPISLSIIASGLIGLGVARRRRHQT